ncbi:cilia- and flagella-associated protein 251-like [Phymastichus coffea]|uniref:cilia- and flagella-associated protein 251-like n=1 Tax=Phymastichus coffea TaxID=108790 RepID=UPI00273B7CCA|nr:cilia- and flagella-associated protein 251-like [Phymastichus coffea]
MSESKKSSKSAVMAAMSRKEETKSGEQEWTKKGRGRTMKGKNEKKENGGEKDIRKFMQKEEENKEIGFAKSVKLVHTPPRKLDEGTCGKVEKNRSKIIEQMEETKDVDDKVTKEINQDETRNVKDVEEKQEEINKRAEDKSSESQEEEAVQRADEDQQA